MSLRLKRLREYPATPLDTFSDQSEPTHSHLSHVERELDTPSRVATLELAHVLKANIEASFADARDVACHTRVLRTSRTNGFWRDPALPFVEARWVGDGRTICHAAHSHDSFSIGVITGGCNSYRSGHQRMNLRAGATVMMNPGVVHACNPIADQPWSYLMLYIDMPWLQRQGFALPAQTHSWHPQLYTQVLQTAAVLFDVSQADADREAGVCQLLDAVVRYGVASAGTVASVHCALDSAAAFIRAHCCEPLTLEDIGAACGLSRGYLIRAFGQRFGLTPHGYLVDQRVRYARARLRLGGDLARTALEAGFADQAHLQRAFKRYLAVTPGDYRRALRPGSDALLAQFSSR